MKLPSLKDLIGIELKEAFNNFSLIKIDRSQKTTIIDKRTIRINYSELTPNEKKEFAQIIRTQAIPSQQAVINSDSKEKTLGIKAGLPTNPDKQLITFYNQKLSPEYLEALEIALVIKNKKLQDQEAVKELKKDVHSKYPIFGNNLCNLVSEGYFHHHFKDLFQQMSENEDNFTVGTYRKKVEQIVVSLPYTIFVNSHHSKEELSGLILYKLQKLKEYGSQPLRVHALNVENVLKAQDVINNLISSEGIQVDYDPKKQSYMTAILRIPN
jgi:hypothetical protein